MLPNGAILRAVAAEVLPAMTRGAVHSSTAPPSTWPSARAVAAQAADAGGAGAVDAPVSGGIGGAARLAR